MNWLKICSAVFGVLITILAASADSSASTFAENERTVFKGGQVQIDAAGNQQWLQRGNSEGELRMGAEAANARTLTLSHAETP